jgi:protease I
MSKVLKGLKVAILIANGFEQSEMEKPRKALEDAGAKVDIVSPESETVKSWYNKSWGEDFNINVELEKANPSDYQALLLPGGVMNPDKLRLNEKAISFIKEFVDKGKPIAAICHGPWTLINANGVKGKTMTAWPSLEIDLTNAGAHFVDRQVVRDGQLVTSRKPDDIPAFNSEMIKLFSEANRKLAGV